MTPMKKSTSSRNSPRAAAVKSATGSPDGRRRQRCSRCGEFRKGHTCTVTKKQAEEAKKAKKRAAGGAAAIPPPSAAPTAPTLSPAEVEYMQLAMASFRAMPREEQVAKMARTIWSPAQDEVRSQEDGGLTSKLEATLNQGVGFGASDVSDVMADVVFAAVQKVRNLRRNTRGERTLAIAAAAGAL